jgi:hypothetical protein
MSTITTIEEVFTTNCGCYDCPKCGLLMTSDEEAPTCDECQVEGVMSDYCQDVCYDYKHENWRTDFFPTWLKLVGEPEHLLIQGRSMGWQRLNGVATLDATWTDLFRALSINGEYTLRMKLEGENFTVVRSSHDEPTGAHFSIHPTIVFEED